MEDNKRVSFGVKAIYLAQLVFTVIGLVLQAILTFNAVFLPHHKFKEGLAACIIENILPLVIFVTLFIYAFFYIKKDGKLFYAIAILNIAYATAQIESAQAFFAVARPILMSLLSIHLGLLTAFVVLINVNSNRALWMMRFAIISKISYHLGHLGIYILQDRLQISAIREEFVGSERFFLFAKMLIPLLIDTSIYFCYKAKLRHGKGQITENK